MGAVPSVPSAAIKDIKEAKIVAEATLNSAAEVDFWNLLASIVASIHRCLEMFWDAAYQQDKDALEAELQAAIDLCDNMEEVTGPDMSRVRSLLSNALTSIQNWVVGVI